MTSSDQGTTATVDQAVLVARRDRAAAATMTRAVMKQSGEAAQIATALAAMPLAAFELPLIKEGQHPHITVFLVEGVPGGHFDADDVEHLLRDRCGLTSGEIREVLTNARR